MKQIAIIILVGLAAGCAPTEGPATTGSQTEDAVLSWRPELNMSKEWVSEVQQEAMSQFDMNKSAALGLEILDADLYISLTRYAQHCSAQERKQLFEAHMAWLDIRSDAGVRARITYAGGTMAPLMEITEMSVLTEERIEQFRTLSDTPKGSCTSPENRSNVLLLTDDGLGGISGEVPFKESAIAAAQPDLELTLQQMEFPSGIRETLMFSYRGNYFGYIHPDTENQNVGRIELEGEWSTGPNGELINSRMSELDPDRFTCHPGLEEYSGFAVCKDETAPHVTYVFENDWSWSGPDDELPPREQLLQARLYKLFWHAQL